MRNVPLLLFEVIAEAMSIMDMFKGSMVTSGQACAILAGHTLFAKIAMTPYRCPRLSHFVASSCRIVLHPRTRLNTPLTHLSHPANTGIGSYSRPIARPPTPLTSRPCRTPSATSALVRARMTLMSHDLIPVCPYISLNPYVLMAV